MSKSATLFDLYFEYVKDTESPLIFHRWSLIASVGALLGRQYYLPFGTTRIFPNQYIMLIGNPGTRKSSAIKTSKKILAHTGYETFAAEKTTKEKFLLDLEGAPDGEQNAQYHAGNSRRKSGASNILSTEDVLRNLDLTSDVPLHDGTPREIFICADEFNEFAGSGNLDFLSMLGSLWDWDDESVTYKHRFKNSKSISIYQPTISILGGNTHTGFQEAFPIQAIGQGFMSRLLLIHGEPSGRKIAFPTKPPESIGAALQELFTRIAATVKGEAILTPEARNALDMIYRAWQELEDFRFKHYSTRRFTHLLKLVLITSAMRCSCKIEMQDVLLANTILTHAEHGMPKALGEFGKSRHSEATQNVMAALFDTKKPLSFEDLWKVVSRDLDKRDQLTDIIISLTQAGKIQGPDPKAGRLGFLPATKPVSTKSLYVDFKLIKEMEGRI